MIFAFTSRLNMLAMTRNIRILKQSIDTCLKGEAEQCWNYELSNIERVGLIHDPNGPKLWCQTLEE